MKVIVKKNGNGEVMCVFGPYYYPNEAHTYSVELQKAYPNERFIITDLVNFRMLCENDT